MADAMDDPYRWLEDVDGERALAWVRERNAATTAMLDGDPEFARLRDQIRQVLDADERIPAVTWRGDRLYNFWQDARNPRGLWRRTTLDGYRKREPEWEVLLDLDALAEREGENWVWQGEVMLHPEYRRCLISLSRGGADACVVREFDVDTRSFVSAGFGLPEAKSSVAWIDADTVYVATDFGPGTLTESGYPRIVKQWRRGTPLADATEIFAAEPAALGVEAWHDPTPGFERDFVLRYRDFFHTDLYLRGTGDSLSPVDVPPDAEKDVHREWLLVRLRSPWQVAGRTHPAGALLAARFADFMAGRVELEALFTPTPSAALTAHYWTRHHLVLSILDDVRGRLELLTPPAADATGPWQRAVLADDSYGHVENLVTNPYDSDGYLLRSSGFLQPPAVRYGQAGVAGPVDKAGQAGTAGPVDKAGQAGTAGPADTPGPAEIIRETPAFFATDGLSVRQFFATSADGTRVPYFVVGRPGAGPGPTLLTGYGGFALASTPSYNGATGRGWLARGGTFVVANIRGGGEYGPRWHQAAMRDKRPRAYEDFASVATDLVERGITTRAQLGAEGGSNGGLLMGVMLTRYPHLFGAIAIQVPLLDMRRYHRLLAGASWVAEYGDPDNPDDWAYLKEFSPYHNVRPAQPYPPVLLYTSTRDDRVHPGHARKMAALLSDHGYEVTFYENIEGGHGGAADNAQLAFKRALILHFLAGSLREVSELG